MSMCTWNRKWFHVKTKRSETDGMSQSCNERRVVTCTRAMFYFDNTVNNMNMIQGEVGDYYDAMLYIDDTLLEKINKIITLIGLR